MYVLMREGYWRSLGVLIAWGMLASWIALAQPAISNIAVSQRSDGSGMVDIYYDLFEGAGEIVVDVLISNDVGAADWLWPVAVYLAARQ